MDSFNNGAALSNVTARSTLELLVKLIVLGSEAAGIKTAQSTIDKSSSVPITMTPSIAYKLLKGLHQPATCAPDTAWKGAMPLFVNEAEHWKPSNHPSALIQLLFWLEQFICGSIPPARCEGYLPSGDGIELHRRCPNVAVKPLKYCDVLHKCLSHNNDICSRIRITSEADAILCNFHECAYNQCHRERLSPGFKFCENHICTVCIVSGSGLNSQAKVAGGNACELHTCHVTGCKTSSIHPYIFCEAHLCVLCCSSPDDSVDMSPRLGESLLCTGHKCHINTCWRPHFLNSDFCSLHTCLVCLEKGNPVPASILDPGFPVCPDHSCQHPEYKCRTIAEDCSIYCFSRKLCCKCFYSDAAV